MVSNFNTHKHEIAEQFVVDEDSYHQTTLCLCRCNHVISCVAVSAGELLHYNWGEWRLPTDYEFSMLPKWAKEEL